MIFRDVLLLRRWPIAGRLKLPPFRPENTVHRLLDASSRVKRFSLDWNIFRGRRKWRGETFRFCQAIRIGGFFARWFIQITARPRLSDRNGGHFVRIIERDYVLTKRRTIIRCINKPTLAGKNWSIVLTESCSPLFASSLYLPFFSVHRCSSFRDRLIIACNTHIFIYIYIYIYAIRAFLRLSRTQRGYAFKLAWIHAKRKERKRAEESAINIEWLNWFWNIRPCILHYLNE